eukprot:g19498.t1
MSRKRKALPRRLKKLKEASSSSLEAAEERRKQRMAADGWIFETCPRYTVPGGVIVKPPEWYVQKQLKEQLFERKEELVTFHQNFGDTRMKEEMKDIFRRASSTIAQPPSSDREFGEVRRGASFCPTEGAFCAHGFEPAEDPICQDGQLVPEVFTCRPLQPQMQTTSHQLQVEPHATLLCRIKKQEVQEAFV